MILNRVATALKKQDWTTVFIEFVLIIVGVLIALEVDRYNEQQLERAEEVRLLESVLKDVEQDQIDFVQLNEILDDIRGFTQVAIKILSTKGCIDNCWSNLVALFHSTQWINVSTNITAYREISQQGLPKNQELKRMMREYYDMNDNRANVGGKLPEYRTLIRSLIPPDVQDELWANCFETYGRMQSLIADCKSTITEQRAEEIVKLIQANPSARSTLTFWMSNLSILIITQPDMTKQAEALSIAITEEASR